MSLKINLAQIKTDPANLDGNCAKILDAIKTAKKENADIIVFPELTISGYGASNYLLNDGFIDNVKRVLNIIIKNSSNITIIVGYPEAHKNKIYSSTAIIQDGNLLGSHRKVLLPTSDLFSENYYLSPGSSPSTLEVNGTKIGIAISEDILDHHALPKCDLLILSAAFNWSYTKAEEKESIIQELVRSLKTPTIFVNAFTATDNLIFSGTSAIYNDTGKAVVRLRRFKEEQITIDTSSIEKIKRLPSPPIRGQEALYEALKFSLKEHLSKIGQNKVTLLLNNRIESQLLLSLAIDTLGKDHVTPLIFNHGNLLPSELKQILALCNTLNVNLIQKEVSKEDIINLSKTFQIDETQSFEWFEFLTDRIQNALFITYANMINACPLGELNKTQLSLGTRRAASTSLSYYMPFYDLYRSNLIDLLEFRNILTPLFNRDQIDKEKNRSIRHPLIHVQELKLSIIDDIIYRYIERHESPEYITQQYDDPELVNSLVALIRKTKQQRSRTIAGPQVSSRSITKDWHFPRIHTDLEEKSYPIKKA